MVTEAIAADLISNLFDNFLTFMPRKFHMVSPVDVNIVRFITGYGLSAK